jgi:hypothetical protein
VQVLFGDLFADACEILKRYSVHFYLWRFKDAPLELAATAGNTVPILVNTKETAATLETCTTLILEWLIALGPDSGAHLAKIRLGESLFQRISLQRSLTIVLATVLILDI